MTRPILITVALILASVSRTPADGDAYVGRWNVKITDAADTFASSGFQIERKAGVLAAGIVWRWGSYLSAKSVRVAPLHSEGCRAGAKAQA